MNTSVVPSRLSPSGSHGQAGFTLAELLMTLLVLSLLVLGLLGLFDLNNRVARVQMNVTDMQQSLRAAQYDMVHIARMAGRGPVPAMLVPNVGLGYAGKRLPNGIAVSVTPANSLMKMGGCDCAKVVKGTDILTVRGVFSTPVYQVRNATLTLDGGPPATEGSIVIEPVTPSGIPQDLNPLKTAINEVAMTPEALILISPQDDSVYAVVELDAGSTINGDGSLTVRFKISGGTYTTPYNQISPDGRFSPDLMRAAYVGILEEYRYYIREDWSGAANNSDFSPKLARARFFPGTDVKWGNPATPAAELAEDIADNVFDLQVALGIDVNGNGVIDENADLTKDEWLYNAAADSNDPASWEDTPLGQTAKLLYVRISTAARSDRRDPQYRAPLLTTMEDRSYAAASGEWDLNGETERMYRRDLLQTVVDLRNIS